MPLKLTACRRQGSPGLVSYKEAAAEFLFEGVDPRADGRLTDPQMFGGLNEVAGRHNGQECPGEFSIHNTLALISILLILTGNIITFVKENPYLLLARSSDP
jgi:hypothetical protein